MLKILAPVLTRLNNISVVMRVISGFVILVVLMIIASGISFLTIRSLNNQVTDITVKVIPLQSDANKASIGLLTANRHFKDFITSQDRTELEASRAAFEQSVSSFAALQQSLLAHSNTFTSLKTQIGLVDNVQSSVFEVATQAMTEHEELLNGISDLGKRQAEFQLQLPLLKQYINTAVIKSGDDFIRFAADEYFNALGVVEKNAINALNSANLAEIDQSITLLNNAKSNYQTKLADLEEELPDLRNDVGYVLPWFDKAIWDPEGVIALHRKQVETTSKVFANAAKAARNIAEVLEGLDVIAQFGTQQVDSATRAASAEAGQGQIVTIITLLISVLLAGLIAFSTALAIRKPLNHLVNVLTGMANGDMSQRLPDESDNELGQIAACVNRVAMTMRDILGKLTLASEKLAEVAAANQSHSQKSKVDLDRQRQETAGVAAAITQMSASVAEVASSAGITLEKVHEVEAASNAGREVMSKNITTTHQLSAKLDKSSEVIGQVDGYSNNIGSILDVIRGIAEQTNLLALNAAIEAARAGEQGRGFAVVADEVRNLAQKTADSTSEIQQMIESLQASAKQAVVVMSECSGEMESSLMQASEANSSMEEIQGIVTQISDMSSHIASAAEQQQKTSEDISKNINQITEISDENYASMEQIAAGSQQLEALAAEQEEIVHRFKL